MIMISNIISGWLLQIEKRQKQPMFGDGKHAYGVLKLPPHGYNVYALKS